MNKLEVISDIFCSRINTRSDIDEGFISPQLFEKAKLAGLSVSDIIEIYTYADEVKEKINEQADEESEYWSEEY